MLLGALALPAAATLGGAIPAAAAAPVDWSRAVIDSTMKRYTPETLGGWGYTRGLYLYGQYLFFKRTGERSTSTTSRRGSTGSWTRTAESRTASAISTRCGRASCCRCCTPKPRRRWFGMTAIDLLETLPRGHQRRQGLIDVVKHLAAGYARYQDDATGLCYQVADRGGDAKGSPT